MLNSQTSIVIVSVRLSSEDPEHSIQEDLIGTRSGPGRTGIYG